ncbi:helix-turn-helix domain-containing protein [Nocardia sp. NPDC060249]|uniref:helix-turn-helix domain-containing protein n=1 Tax=Nocardia sp. NPDC060249 TaxID=3347082 RepID=UPI0036664713
MTIPGLLTSGEAVEVIYDGTGYRFRPADLQTLVRTNILPNHGSGKHLRFALDDLHEFIKTYPYRRNLPFPYLGVSVLELCDSPAYELHAPHALFRRFAGYDHDNTAGLTPSERTYAIVAKWRIGFDTAQWVVEQGLPLLGSIKGVVTLDTIFWPTGVARLVGGIGFEVAPDRRGHPEIGMGAIVDVPPGPPWRLVPTSAPSTDSR